MDKTKVTSSPLDNYSDELAEVIEVALLEELGNKVEINIDVVRRVTIDVLDFARSICTKEGKDIDGIQKI